MTKYVLTGLVTIVVTVAVTLGIVMLTSERAGEHTGISDGKGGDATAVPLEDEAARRHETEADIELEQLETPAGIARLYYTYPLARLSGFYVQDAKDAVLARFMFSDALWDCLTEHDGAAHGNAPAYRCDASFPWQDPLPIEVVSFEPVSRDESTATVHATAGGITYVVFELVREHGRWRIDGFQENSDFLDNYEPSDEDRKHLP